MSEPETPTVSAPVYKVFHLLAPREGLSPAAFSQARAPHIAAAAAAAAAAAGFLWYVSTPRTRDGASLERFQDGGCPFAAVDTFAFSSAGAARAFVASSAYEEGPGRDEAGLLDGAESCWLVTREHVLVNGGPIGPLDSGPGVKVIGALRRTREADLDDFRHRWLAQHGPYVVATAGVSRYIQNHVVVGAYAAGEPRYDGVIEVWHRTRADLDACFSDPMMSVVQAADIPTLVDTRSFFTLECDGAEAWVCGSRPGTGGPGAAAMAASGEGADDEDELLGP